MAIIFSLPWALFIWSYVHSCSNLHPTFFSRDRWHLRQDVVVSHSRDPIFLEYLKLLVTDSYYIDICLWIFPCRVYVGHLGIKGWIRSVAGSPGWPSPIHFPFTASFACRLCALSPWHYVIIPHLSHPYKCWQHRVGWSEGCCYQWHSLMFYVLNWLLIFYSELYAITGGPDFITYSNLRYHLSAGLELNYGDTLQSMLSSVGYILPQKATCLRISNTY